MLTLFSCLLTFFSLLLTLFCLLSTATCCLLLSGWSITSVGLSSAEIASKFAVLFSNGAHHLILAKAVSVPVETAEKAKAVRLGLKHFLGLKNCFELEFGLG